MAEPGKGRLVAIEPVDWIKAVHENERIQTIFRKLELRLMGCSTLEQWLRVVFLDVQEALCLDGISLDLYDPNGVIRDLCFEQNIDFSILKSIRLEDEPRALRYLFPHKVVLPRLGMIRSNQIDILFNGVPLSEGSVALVPMMVDRCLIGSINCFSYNASRFTSDLATDFLSHFASVASYALGNVTEKGKLENLCRQDRLTSLGNKRALEERLLQEIARSIRFGESLSICFVDFDHFKKLNDTYGHDVGDVVLRQIGSVFKNKLRGSDWAARFGGEEFVVVLPKTDLESACLVAERLRERVALHSFLTSGGEIIKATVSIGVAELTEVNENSTLGLRDALLKHADKRLYLAKSRGRNQVCGALSL